MGAFAIFGVISFNIFSREFLNSVMSIEEMSLESACLECILATFSCASAAVVLGFSKLYLKNELAAGTPFTHEGAKEMLRLGIISMAVPVVASVINNTVSAIFIHFYPSAEPVEMSVSLAAGLAMVLAYFIFEYGAELRENKEKENN